ncbi:hypothetical protein [Clostridioides difficile]|uniref:hypothetical protein n=1 Tax=Clostridioides difficile TaxID=1496 RepID=UPI001EDB98D4|nr:hypothetical protein [Clostridioides difficile]
MGIRDTKMEAELENNIIEYLTREQKYGAYQYITPDEMKLSYNRKYAFDEIRLLTFIKESQPGEFDILRLDTEDGKDKFLNSLMYL